MNYSWGLWLFWGAVIVLVFFGILAWRSRQRKKYFDYSGTTPRLGRNKGHDPRGYCRSDARITEDINDQLMIANDVDATDIDVKAKDGIVTLSGTVETRAEKRIAEAIADSTPGVLDVTSHLRIRGSNASEQGRSA